MKLKRDRYSFAARKRARLYNVTGRYVYAESCILSSLWWDRWATI